MVQQSLVSYIREQLRGGYDINTIKAYLINQGYNESIVNEAINQAYQVKHVFHLSKGTIIAFISLFLSVVLIASIIFIYTQKSTPKQVMDLKVSILSSPVEKGGLLEFNVELLNLGSSKRYDVNLKHTIVDLSNNVLTFKEETVALETRASLKSEIKIPKNAKPGNYVLKTTAFYNNKVATAIDSFRIYEKRAAATCFDNIQNQGETGIDCGGQCEPCKTCPDSCDDFDYCTEDKCDASTNYKCDHNPIIPCCGNNICESNEDNENCAIDCKETVKEKSVFKSLTVWEKLELIENISKTNLELAGNYCLTQFEQQEYKEDCLLNIAQNAGSIAICSHIKTARTKDKCRSSVAKISGNSDYCKDISASNRRDACYMNFIIDGDYTLCDKIDNEYLRQSCGILRNKKEWEQTHGET